jgi:hypothetical protein
MVMICGVALTAGCSMLAAPRCAQPLQLSVNEMLYFGTATPDGVVSAKQWADFLNEAVTPRFPQGFSSWQASGRWQSADGQLIRERSYVVAIDHRDELRSDAAVREIIALYKKQFQQEAVLRVRSLACTMF